MTTSRHCSRPGCAEPAAATLTYHYDRSLVWLDPLVAERDPHRYDLCEQHAARLGVPRGWRLEDRRVLAVVPPPVPAPLPAGDLPALPALPARLAG